MLSGTFTVTTSSHMELIDITSKVQEILHTQQISSGFCYLFNPHTTAGLTINEGADPAVCRDIIAGFRQMIPMELDFHHREGNSPSHIMASLMGCSLTIAIDQGQPLLGTWQKLFFCEFDGPRTRQVHWRLADTSQP